MDREQLHERVKALRNEGKSIRAVAAELAVHPSRVQRALKALERQSPAEAAPSAGTSASRTRRPDEVFVGRERELNELRSAWDDVLAGRGRLMVLVGEPGIGKTRTAQELAAYATLRGGQALWGRCHASQGTPSYWPWVQVIGSYVRECTAEQLHSRMGVGAADIAEVVSDVRERLPDLKPPPALDPQQARFRLFDSITAFLKRASQARPLVIVLDNLHWADQSSLLLLEFVAQELVESPMLVLGTYRDTELTRQHPLPHTLGELARDSLFRQLPLGGLREEEVSKFVEVTLGFTPPRDLVEAVHIHTEGNPLFMTQVVRLLVQQGEPTPEQVARHQGWSLQIPVEVHEAIRRRLNQLSHRCNQVLTVASVVGREFDLGLLEVLMDELSGDELLEALEEALAARVIEDLPQAVGRFRFTHVLIQNTLSRELSTVRRTRLHQRIAEALEELYGSDIAAHAAELVYYFAQAAPLMGTEKLAQYSLLAGERALATYAHEEGLKYFERGLAAKEGQPMDAETAELLFGLGRAQAATLQRHETQQAVATLTRAFDYYAAAGQVDRAVAVAEYPITVLPGYLTQMSQLIARALSLVSPESHNAGRLQSRYGAALGLEEGDYYGAQAAFGRALAIAQRDGDTALEMRTLANASRVDYYSCRLRDSITNSLRAIELARHADDTHAEMFAHYNAASALHTMGELEKARPHAAALLALAGRLRDRLWLASGILMNESLYRLKGDWPASRDFIDRSPAIAATEPRLLTTQVLVEFEVGNFSRGQAHLERLLEVMRRTEPGPTLEWTFPAMVIPMVARITGVASDFEVAEAAAATVLSSSCVTPLVARFTRVGLGLIAVQRRDVAAAAEQYAALESQRGTMLALIISADRVLGLLSVILERLDQAMIHFEGALVFCREGGYRPEYAWSAHDYAEALLQRNSPGDRARVMSLLDESLAVASELGMRPLMQWVATLKEQAQSRSGRTHEYPDGLTQREVEVLRSVAAGRSNREIAAELVLSVRTVERHITNVYRKIGTSRRASATTYALRHNLVNYK